MRAFRTSLLNRSASAVLLLLAAGCGRLDSGDRPPAGFPDTPERWRAASPLREVAVSDSDAMLTQIASLDVDSRGRIYVPDPFRQQVVVFAPDGSLLRTFSGRGRGPGEFRMIRGIQVLPGDSVLVYDPTLGRVSVFAPDADAVAYTVNLRQQLSGPPPFQVRRTNANDAFLALFRPGFAFRPGADFRGRTDRVRLLALDGTLRADLLTFPSRAFLVAGNSVTPHPFGHEGFARLDSRDRLHFVWSDSLGVATYDLAGERIGGFRIGFTPPRVRDDDVEQALTGLSGESGSEFTSVLADSIPSRWPAVQGVLVDDRDRLWMAIGGSRRVSTEWAAFSSEGDYLGSILVPHGVEVRLIRGDGTVYAERVDENDVPSVVVYRMVQPHH